MGYEPQEPARPEEHSLADLDIMPVSGTRYIVHGSYNIDMENVLIHNVTQIFELSLITGPFSCSA